MFTNAEIVVPILYNVKPCLLDISFKFLAYALSSHKILPLKIGFWLDCFFIVGTTGRPKGVTISHSALVVQSLAKIAIIGYSEDDVYLYTAPLCHIGGLSSAMALLMVGGCHVLFPKFEAKSAVEAIEQHSVTSLITVPTIMADLITLIRKKETWKGKDNMKKILNGGGSLSVELIKDATKYFPKAKLFSAYVCLACPTFFFHWMTETRSSLTFTTIYDPTIETPSQLLETSGKKHCNSVHQPQGVCVGKPAPHIELKICIDGSSNVGRILTRGPHVMQRYWDHVPEKPSDLDDEAWLDTGDIGHIDNCGNIETILLRHQGVIAVVVVGIPDTRLTEMVVACVKLRDNRQWSDSNSEQPAENKQLYLCSEVLRQHCRENNLTGYCLLNYVSS
ncbi:hypothetical protein Patl1_11407 [Pistacia atlantica]|uniref:Uncharacterized protein n=1 Tax=Pistacia atlantica TaxID=434234 RepID=A0ACC1A3U3_9ROSI|nr:hypothetical protein Patl1_11407 [Pistacia atlantica]